MPSHDNASPNGLPEAVALQLVAAVFGKMRTCVVSARSVASGPLGSRYAHCRAVARALITALYAATVAWRLASSAGSMLWSLVQSSVSGTPAAAAPINPKPY